MCTYPQALELSSYRIILAKPTCERPHYRAVLIGKSLHQTMTHKVPSGVAGICCLPAVAEHSLPALGSLQILARCRGVTRIWKVKFHS